MMRALPQWFFGVSALLALLSPLATNAATDEEKLEMMKRYAPRVWLHSQEEYFPSSVEWAFQYMRRVKDGDGRYRIVASQPLSSPSDDSLPLFKGEMDNAPVYAFWVAKPASELERQMLKRGKMTVPNVVDIVYFFYYPYNRGKEVLDTMWGNHVSDWEHITVRLEAKGKGSARALHPTKVYVSAHDFGGEVPWDSISKVEPSELERQLLKIKTLDHPVVYSAWGSHGVWKDPGSHTYKTVAFTDLTDHTDKGHAWNTWMNVVAFDFNEKKGLGSHSWPRWMRTDFTSPGAGDPSKPAAGAIYRWGNPGTNGDSAVLADITGQKRLADGPTGPVSKDTWGQALR